MSSEKIVLTRRETTYTARYFNKNGAEMASIVLKLEDELFHARGDGYNLGQYLEKGQAIKAVEQYLRDHTFRGRTVGIKPN